MHKFFQNESGATAIEYGLIAALIAVAIIGAVSAVGGSVSTTFNDVSAEIDGAGTPAAAEE
ncbi:MAG: Flp family type IVb pilin [Pseudomonadota bacterium]